MVYTGAQHSVLNKKLGPMSKKTSLVQAAMGTKRYCWTTERKVNLGTHQVSHSFLVIPECPAPLLGRDLLTKVNAQIHFDPGGMSVMDGLGWPIHALSLALRDYYRLFVPKLSETIAPDVQLWGHKDLLAWAETAGVGLAKQRHTVVIELKAEATCEGEAIPYEPGGSAGDHSPHSMAHGCRNSQAVPIPLEHPLTAGEEARE